MDKFGKEGRVRYRSSSDPVQYGGFESGSVWFACKLNSQYLKIISLQTHYTDLLIRNIIII